MNPEWFLSSNFGGFLGPVFIAAPLSAMVSEVILPLFHSPLPPLLPSSPPPLLLFPLCKTITCTGSGASSGLLYLYCPTLPNNPLEQSVCSVYSPGLHSLPSSLPVPLSQSNSPLPVHIVIGGQKGAPPVSSFTVLAFSFFFFFPPSCLGLSSVRNHVRHRCTGEDS